MDKWSSSPENRWVERPNVYDSLYNGMAYAGKDGIHIAYKPLEMVQCKDAIYM